MPCAPNIPLGRGVFREDSGFFAQSQMLCVSLKTKGYLFKATLEFLEPGSESKARGNEREILKDLSKLLGDG